MAGADRLVLAWYRGAWWLWLLRPLELVFRTVAALRRALYQNGLLPSYRCPVPVVVIGNITVGGTGKTPAVIALVESLQARGIRVGVVSRGYGARELQAAYRVTDDSHVYQCGDEPLLIQRRTGCPCVVAPSRADAVRTLLADTAVDIIVSDDGLQHYALQRDLEIALLDAERGIGNGFCLPAGPLREPASRLKTVDHVLYRGSGDESNGLQYRQVALVHLSSGKECAVSPSIIGNKVHAIAGIGQPEQFFTGLERQGFKLQRHPLGDHHDYRVADFEGLADKPLIMTEKDAVKCASIAGDNAWYLKIDAQLPRSVTESVAMLVRP